MVDFNSALIKKIVRLLESNHDGERAAAAGKLHGMAKDKGKNIDEMLAVVYGGGARQKPEPAHEQPRRKQSSWGNEWGGGNFQDPPWDTNKDSFAEGVRRQQEAEMKRQAEGVRRRYEAAEKAEREAKRYGDARDELQKHIDLWGLQVLSSWEKVFVGDILRCGRMTPRQEEIVDSIIERYVNFGKRNGEDDAFWKA